MRKKLFRTLTFVLLVSMVISASGCGLFSLGISGTQGGRTPVINTYTDLNEEGAPDPALIELTADDADGSTWELTEYDKTLLYLRSSECVSGLYKFSFCGVKEGETDLSFTKHKDTERGKVREEITVYSISIDADLNVEILECHTRKF